MSDPSHPIFARLYDPVMAPAERTSLVEHRRYLVDDISGDVLDLGAGTGAMFPYFAERAAEEQNLELVAIEPDPHMLRKARDRAQSVDLDISLEEAGAESLPFPDDSFDTVVASLVFCTIPDMDAALSEVARVLRPGGEFRFLEHVRGERALGVAHDVLKPAWHALAGGCHLNRQTDDIFRADDRFTLVDFRRLDSALTPVVPVVRGTLERRADGLLTS